MFKYAIKSIKSKKVVSFLYVLSLTITLIVSMLSINITTQIQEGFYMSDQKYDVIVGKKGSSTQLLLSSIFFSDEPLGTIPYSIVDELKGMDSNMKVVPLGVGDNYNGRRIVGSTVDLLDGYSYKEGRVFKNHLEIVVGYSVAKAYNLSLGSEIVSSHGVVGAISGHDHSDTPYKVVGVLDKTNTSYDEVLFVNIEDVWSAHSHEEDDHSEEEYKEEHKEGEHDHSEEEHSEDGHSHTDASVTAILVRSGDLGVANKIINTYDTNSDTTQAINVTQVLRKLMNTVDLSKQVALILSGLVVLLSLLIVIIMTYMLHKNYDRDLKILNVLGASKGSVLGYVGYQHMLLVMLSVIISLLVSRLCLYGVNTISSQMGIILDYSKFYKLEFTMVVAVSILSILPIVRYIKSKVER